MTIDPAILKRKPYLGTLIDECGEALEGISQLDFLLLEPHPYKKLGAPYGNASPWMLRTGVLKALHEVRKELTKHSKSLSIAVFDAYRPNAVQQFMVDWQFGTEAARLGTTLQTATAEQRAIIDERVYGLWAIPSYNPMTPPPHSTGAAIDLTIVDAGGNELNMGSKIDEIEGQLPDHFANAKDTAGREAHANRILLNEIMSSAGFWRNPHEWWHFSIGDQSAVWLEQQKNPQSPVRVARYGRADLVK